MPAIHAFQKSKRLRETDEISSVFSFKCQAYGQYLRVLVRPNNVGHPRFTGIIRKKTAPLSVTRNYIKRCLREMFRRNQNLFGGLDVVVLTHKRFTGKSFDLVEQEFLQLVGELQKKLANT
ncbi:MAG TPA: ribonuclease P protein component [Sulfuricella sp.]|nr:ribonuclease P protein component [Sulfuricella sp.]